MRFFEFFIINSFYNIYFFFKFYCIIFCEYFNNSISFYISFRGFSWYFAQITYFYFNWVNILNSIIVDYRHDFYIYWDKVTWDYFLLYREWVRPVTSSELSSETISTYWVGYSLGFKKFLFSFYMFFDTLTFLCWEGIQYFYNNFLILWSWFYYLTFFESMLVFTEPFPFPNHIIAVLIKIFFLAFLFWLPAFWWSRGVEINYWDMYVPPKIQKFYKRFISWGSKRKRRFLILEPYSRMMGFFKTAPLPTVDVLKDIMLYLKYLIQIQSLFVLKLIQFKKIYPNQLNSQILDQSNKKVWINISFETFIEQTTDWSLFFFRQVNFFSTFFLQKLVLTFNFFFIFWYKIVIFLNIIFSYISFLYFNKFHLFYSLFKHFKFSLFFLKVFFVNNNFIIKSIKVFF